MTNGIKCGARSVNIWLWCRWMAVLFVNGNTYGRNRNRQTPSRCIHWVVLRRVHCHNHFPWRAGRTMTIRDEVDDVDNLSVSTLMINQGSTVQYLLHNHIIVHPFKCLVSYRMLSMFRQSLVWIFWAGWKNIICPMLKMDEGCWIWYPRYPATWTYVILYNIGTYKVIFKQDGHSLDLLNWSHLHPSVVNHSNQWFHNKLNEPIYLKHPFCWHSSEWLYRSNTSKINISLVLCSNAICYSCQILCRWWFAANQLLRVKWIIPFDALYLYHCYICYTVSNQSCRANLGNVSNLHCYVHCPNIQHVELLCQSQDCHW